MIENLDMMSDDHTILMGSRNTDTTVSIDIRYVDDSDNNSRSKSNNIINSEETQMQASVNNMNNPIAKKPVKQNVGGNARAKMLNFNKRKETLK